MINFNKQKNIIKANKNFLNKGFTLVETLVALFIFSVSIMTTMTALSTGVSSTSYTKDKIVAEYLSQEGVEYFRNMRNTFSFDTSNGWADFVAKLNGANCDQGNGCYFDNDETTFTDPTSPIALIPITPCGSTCPPFYYDKTFGRYNYLSSGSLTTFSRKMNIVMLGVDNMKITSEVTWKSGGKTHSVSLTENLSNWIE